jgi:SAM-dependent methyltransferase
MEAHEYSQLAEHETTYWWYRAQREALMDEIARIGLSPSSRVLDAGCGSGRVVSMLSERFGFDACGVDVSPYAAALWADRTRDSCLGGSVNDLPFASATFDMVVSMDVIYHRRVDLTKALQESKRVLKNGGILLLMAPAFGWLRSTHDDAVHTVRRFSKSELVTVLTESGLTVNTARYLFAPFFPAIAAVRLWGRHRTTPHRAVARSDMRHLPRWLDSSLFAIARAEQISRLTSITPFGTTVFAVAGKAPA